MLQLSYDNDAQTFDLDRDANRLIVDNELLDTAVMISLFTRRQALPDDALPDPTGHREGWWGDSYPQFDEDKIGSRLWLLSRSKTTQSVLNLAKVYAEESLQWLIDDGIATEVSVETSRKDMTAMLIIPKITLASNASKQWSSIYEAHLEQL